MRAAICGTRHPTAKFLVATAMAKTPVAGSRAMRDQVIHPLRTHSAPTRTREARTTLAPRRVALHAARIGGGLAPLAVARSRRQAPLGPVRPDLQLVAALLQFVLRFLRHAPLDHGHAGARGARPERGEEMLGVPGRRIDRL